MIVRHTQEHGSWIDLYQPSADEIRELMDEYEIPPPLVEDLSSPSRRASVVYAPGILKLTLDFPVVKLSQRECPQELKFFVTTDALISVRYADIAPLHQFGKEFEVLTTLHKTKKALHGGYLFAAVMRTLYTALGQKLDYIEARLIDIGEEMFGGHEKEMVAEISHVSQRLILFQQILTTHEQVLSESKAPFNMFFKDDTLNTALIELERTFRHLMRTVTHLGATIAELRETNNSLLTTKQNEVMTTLTIMALVTFPLTLLSSIFGMNTDSLPLVGFPGDFWMIIGIMAAAALSLFAFFRHKGWM